MSEKRTMSTEKRTMIGEIEKSMNQSIQVENQLELEVKISGWLHRIRRLKNITFLIMRDRTGLVQCVLEPELEASLKFPLTHESVLSICGKVVSGKNTYGNHEILIKSIEALNLAEPELPIQVNNESIDVQLDTLLEHRVLGLRHPKEMAIFKIQAAIAQGFA